MTRRRRWRGPGALAGACLMTVSACAGNDEESCEVPTGEISAVAVVVDSGWDLRATIDFERGDRRGNGTSLRLCDTDLLTINDEIPTETEKANRVEYAIELAPDATRSISFALDREAQGDQLRLDVELPPAFELLSPADGDPLPLGQDLAVQWEPARPGATMRVRLSEELGGGTCLVTSADQTYKEPGGVQVPDDGVWTIPASDLGSGSPEPCRVTLTLERVVLGSYPDVLAGGGRIEGRVERYVDLDASP